VVVVVKRGKWNQKLAGKWQQKMYL
jgi:hypothetical protein